MSGVIPGVPTQMQLTANQAAVVSAAERLINAINVEANQLAGLWGQKKDADALLKLAQQLITFRDAYMKSLDNRIVLAQALPQGAPL